MNRKKTNVQTMGEKGSRATSRKTGQQDPANHSYAASLRLHTPPLHARDTREDNAESKRDKDLETRATQPSGAEGNLSPSEQNRSGAFRADPVLPSEDSKDARTSELAPLSGRKGKRGSTSLHRARAETKKELKKTASNLGTTSEHLRTLLNIIPIPLLIVGRDYYLRYASRGAQRMLNLASYDPAIRVTDTMLALYVPRLRKLLVDLLAGGAAVEREFQDDEDHWYRAVFQPYKVPRVGVDGVVVTLFDIDRQTKLDALLGAAHLRVGQMLDAIAGIFVMLDPQGIIVKMNRQGCELLGYKEEQVTGTNWFDGYVAEASRTIARKVCQQSLARTNGQPLSAEILVRTKAGGERLLRWHVAVYADGAGFPQGLFGVGEDITLWRAAQVSAVESEERFRLLMGMDPESDFLTTDSSGDVTSWYAGSGPAGKLLAHEVIGKHISIFFPAEDFLAGRPMRLLREAETRGRCEEVGWCVGSGGSHRRARFVFSPVRDPAGEVRGFAGVIHYMAEDSRFWRF